jgi:hypothetical protein
MILIPGSLTGNASFRNKIVSSFPDFTYI